MNTDTAQITTDEKNPQANTAASERGPVAAGPGERGSLLLARAFYKRIAAIENQIAAIENQIAAIENQIAAIENQIATINQFPGCISFKAFVR
jgi:phage shock protein A